MLLLADATRLVGVTVIVDLTNQLARLINIVPERSADVFSDWLNNQANDFRTGIAHVAMDALAGYKKAATEVVPDAVTIMDPLHVVAT